MKSYRILFTTILVLAFCQVTALSQSGGPFVIEKIVIAGGGGNSAGGAFVLDGTIGQSLAGTTSSGGAFQLTGGFWGGSAAPVSSVTVSGRVVTPSGLNLRNAVVTLTDPNGVPIRVITGPFGLFSFENVQTGRTYIISVASKRFRFAAQTIPVNGTLTNINFVGLE